MPSSVNRLILMGSSQVGSHLPRNHWSEETGQVTPTPISQHRCRSLVVCGDSSYVPVTTRRSRAVEFDVRKGRAAQWYLN